MTKKMCYGQVPAILTHDPKFTVDEWDAKRGKRPTGIKRIRLTCPECKRRFKSSVSVCDDGCCVYHIIPVPHKPKHWWKKGKE